MRHQKVTFVTWCAETPRPGVTHDMQGREKDWFGCKVSFYDELPFIYCREMHTRNTKNKHSLTEYLSVNEISEYYDFEEVYLLLFNFTYNKSFAFWDIFNFFDINVFVVSGYIHHIDFAGSRLEGTRKMKCIHKLLEIHGQFENCKLFYRCVKWTKHIID